MGETGMGRSGAIGAIRACVWSALALVCAVALPAGPARSQGAAKAGPPPLGIAVLVSSRHDLCYDQGYVGAIRRLVGLEQERINRQGGVNGRDISIDILDDDSRPEKTVADLRKAMDDPSTLAMIGLSNSNRAKAAFETLGKDLADKAIPFISNISVSGIFKGVPNVYSTQVSQDEARAPVLGQFIRNTGFHRVAFVGLDDQVYSTALGDGLKKQLGEGGLVADLRLRSKDDKLDAAGLAAAVSDLKAKVPDMVVVGMAGNRADELLAALVAAGVTPSLFVTGRIEALPGQLVSSYPNAIYQLAWNGLPDADNDRLRRVIANDPAETWVFEGRKIPEAPGWANGECKPRRAVAAADPLESANQRAIALGAQYADMVSLIAEAARSAPPETDLQALRRHVLKQLATTFAAGRGVFKGRFEAWSFHTGSRTAARTPFVVILPQGLGHTQLAPLQFVRLKDGSLHQMETLYLDIDLIRAHRIEDNEKAFTAEFYLSMRANGDTGIESIDFTNAFLDPKTNGRQITVEQLHAGGTSATYPENMKIYKVTGRFTFEPELARYPFDTQRFAIDIQPKRADRPFVVQPPPNDLRGKSVATDGWDVRTKYVGYSEDVVPLLDAYTLQPSVVPFYKASFVWQMKRQTTDYFLRVVVPLGFILIVAYFSFFIPTAHFEAIVTIQVTALLSAVALYLSLPKLDSDDATISDRLFVFNYMMVSLMIGISILRVSGWVTPRRWFKRTLAVLHVVGIPALVIAMAIYVLQQTRL